MSKFNSRDADGRAYYDITFPVGTFRAYEDDPYTYTQVKQSPDEPDWIEPLFEAWERGDMKVEKKNK
jgi:hypothetical protein